MGITRHSVVSRLNERVLARRRKRLKDPNLNGNRRIGILPYGVRFEGESLIGAEAHNWSYDLSGDSCCLVEISIIFLILIPSFSPSFPHSSNSPSHVLFTLASPYEWQSTPLKSCPAGISRQRAQRSLARRQPIQSSRASSRHFTWEESSGMTEVIGGFISLFTPRHCNGQCRQALLYLCHLFIVQ